MDNIEVYNNKIYNANLAGIWLEGYNSYIKEDTNVHIHHNTITGSGICNGLQANGAGILTHGFNVLIEDNVLDSNYQDGISANVWNTPPSDAGFVLDVRNNIITNTLPTPTESSTTGYGLNNYETATHTIISNYNYIYNNALGDYKNTGSTTDINEAPTDNDLNNAPVLNFIGSRTVDVGNTLNFIVSASDADGDSLAYSVIGLPRGANFGVVSGEFSWIPDSTQTGTYTVTFEVTDGKLTDSETMTINVNSVVNAPVLNSIGDMSVTEGSLLSFVISASDADGDSLTYSASGLPSGAAFDGASRLFSWKPVAGQAGIYDITFAVTDGQLTDSEVISITVSPEGTSAGTSDTMYINRLRESTPDATLMGDSYVDLGNIVEVGSYREVMWFDLSEYSTTDAVVSATLSMNWYYPENAPRNQDTVVEIYRAADWDPAQVSWNEKAAGVPWNDAGGDWFDSTGVAQGSMPYASITFSGSDVPDNGVYEFDVTELVQEYVSGEHANTGFFIKARNENDNYIAFDGTANDLKKPKLTVTVSTTSNLAPVMDPIADQVVDEGATLSFGVTASDADGDSLTYSSTGAPAGATFDPATAEFTWTPADSQAGIYGVMFEVSDGELTDSKAILIAVNAVDNDPSGNNAPVITAFEPANNDVFEEGSVINIGVTASDVDGQDLTYLLKIDGVSVSTTSSYVWKSTDNANRGPHVIEAVVSDGTDQVTVQHVITIIKIHPRWDVNQDGVVNILDVTIVAQNLGSEKPHPSWDVNEDGVVNIQDLTIVAHYFGETIQL
ncbi:hypothetical protein MCMEM_0247 [Methanococcoides methylutens MM1]|uniref:Dockerin domain-containing protein n=2 Tax=Methanococcoides methylutens TaxID=2226 RepID=A0A0E3WYM3_METMT|nr:disaggregatase related repeat-containing protein [Methanococcoides methylutens]AKB84300.1 hypothetical protein MCMEM_0247 [Methanococcoides methylutens MM1]